MNKRKPSTNGDTLLGRILTQQMTEQLPDDEDARTRWPQLWELLITTRPDEEHVIDPASLTVRLGSGLWNWSLTSRDLKVGFSGFSPTLAGLFDQVEQQLSAPNVPYRKVGRGEMHLRKRKL